MSTANLTHFIALSLALCALTLLGACHSGGGKPADPNVDYYTCTMHPSVHSHDPNGKCPICSMDLVPVLKKGAAPTSRAAAPGPALSEFSVPVQRQQQIGVTYAAAERRPLRQTIRTVGVVEADRTRRWEFVARADCYVQKLFVTSPGEPVEEGQPLLTVYSPELAAAEREFVNLLNTRDRAPSGEARLGAERSLDAARGRFAQWNVAAPQIAELEKSRRPSESFTFQSPFRGVVGAVPVEQGRKAAAGEPLVEVADLSVVWVWAEFFEEEMPLLARGQKVRLTANAYPGESFEGELSVLDPFLTAAKRTARARIDIANPAFRLRPGMFVNIELAMEMGEELAIPVSAVMPTGTRTLVFVDRQEGRLEPRAVQLGRRFGDWYEVRSGLSEGERVVASANFLIDAESKVQGAVKSFEEPLSQPPEPLAGALK